MSVLYEAIAMSLSTVEGNNKFYFKQTFHYEEDRDDKKGLSNAQFRKERKKTNDEKEKNVLYFLFLFNHPKI